MTRISFALLCAMLTSACNMPSGVDETNVIARSRSNCVKIISNTSAGTGLFLDAQHVAICFHVIAKTTVTASETLNQTDSQSAANPILTIHA